jgi:hypothetical protein
MLPLQGFAAAARCDLITGQAAEEAQALDGPAAAHEHCVQHEHVPDPQHHGCCSDCCLTAVAAATLDWTVPRAAAPQLFLPAPRAPLTISLERLDRPPRHFT